MESKSKDTLLWLAFWGFFTLCAVSICVSNTDLFKKEFLYPFSTVLLVLFGLYRFIKCIIKYK